MGSEATEKAGPGGRPTLYDPAYCERVIAMGREGYSVVEMAADLMVHRDSLYAWAESHPEFSDAFMHGRQLSQAWWERSGRVNLMTTGFNSALWSKNMGCRFKGDWTEKTQTELSGPDGGPIPTTITVVGVSP